jgi:hypothetical protein
VADWAERFKAFVLDAMLRRRTPDPRLRAKLVRWALQEGRHAKMPEASLEPFRVAPMERAELKALTSAQLAARFGALASEHHEADFMPEVEQLYWQIDDVVTELEKREGGQWQALIALYTHPDIRIRYAAAEWTQRFAPELARDRMLAIDDEDWCAQPAPGGVPKRGKLRELTTQALVDRFVAIALEQDEAQLEDRIPKYNRLFMQMMAVEEELKTRDGDQRRMLIPLLGHPHAQVRLTSALATLAVTPDAARRVLLAIVEADEYPQAMKAREMLRSVEEGRYSPS